MPELLENTHTHTTHTHTHVQKGTGSHDSSRSEVTAASVRREEKKDIYKKERLKVRRKTHRVPHRISSGIPTVFLTK